MPRHARSLFDGYEPDSLAADPASDFVIGRLLEAGDRNDLRWLVDRHGEAALVDWLQQHGERQLSDRSRLFWSQVLDVPTAVRMAARADNDGRLSELWPL